MLDVVGAEPCDPGERLRVEEDEHGSHAVLERDIVGTTHWNNSHSPSGTRCPTSAITAASLVIKPVETISGTPRPVDNGDFDSYWAFHLEREHQRLYPSPDQLTA
ncbi:hypothetical protein [Streptomyces sp. NPDC048277]|uniref:hypothetical protein n=1 Tax=Streptomyces sp. NPDC048277 TaxID=3155027 RepID=UPI0034057CC1